ncbi:MAG: hypothetical protein GY757_25825, partial [bacterium]|nr:hypothetical protein [bacterium]
HYLLEYIKSFDILNILLLVGYKGEKIEEYFGNGESLGLRIDYVYEKELLGTGGALKNAGNKLEQEFFLIFGDTYFPIDYRALTAVHEKAGKKGTLTVYSNSGGIFTGNIALDNSGMVAAYDKKNPQGKTGVDSGLSVLGKEVLDLIPPNKRCSFEEEIYPELIAQRQLAAFATDQRFYDMGTVEELKRIEEVLL